MTASSSQGNPVLDACIALIGSVTATVLVVLSIIALVGDSNADLRAICPGTNLWWALLVDTLVIGGGAVGQLHLSNSADDAVYAVVRLACMLGVAIWGLCEALSDCANDHLAGNNVRKMVLIWSAGCSGIWHGQSMLVRQEAGRIAATPCFGSAEAWR